MDISKVVIQTTDGPSGRQMLSWISVFRERSKNSGADEWRERFFGSSNI